MILNIGIGAVLFMMTTVIHAEGALIVLKIYRVRKDSLPRYPRRKKIYLIAGVVILLFLISVAEVSVWAVSYLLIGAINGVEQALYFSMVTFTTLGYGDITLNEQWRLLASFEAANGIIMFGWTTALVIAVVQGVYFSDKQDGS